MAADWGFLAVALSALLCVVSGNEMTIRNSQQWQRLLKFEFGPGEHIEFSYDVSFPTNYSPTYLLFYKEEQYMRAIQTNPDGTQKTCEQKLAVLQESSAEMNQIQFLQESNQNCTLFGDKVTCRGRVHFPGTQPRGWYAVVSRCGNLNNIAGVDFTYWIRKIQQTTPFYPSSGQGVVTSSMVTMAFLALLNQCLA